MFTHPLRQVLCPRKAPHLSRLEMKFSQLDIPEFYVLAIVKIQQVTVVQIIITETFILPMASVTACIPQSVRKQPFLPEQHNLYHFLFFGEPSARNTLPCCNEPVSNNYLKLYACCLDGCDISSLRFAALPG